MAFWESMTAGQMGELARRLDEILDQIEKTNREEYESGDNRQEKLITASIESLHRFLNQEKSNSAFQGISTQCEEQQSAPPVPSATKTISDSRQFYELCDLLEYLCGEDREKVEPFLEACRNAFLENGQLAECAL